MRLGAMSMAMGRYGGVAAPAGPFGNHPTLGDDLVSYWPLNELSGTRNDIVGANHLTDNNTVLYANTGPQGNVAQFVSANTEYLSNNSASFPDGGNTNFFYSTWVKTTSVAQMPIINRGGDGADHSLWMAVTGKLRWEMTSFNHEVGGTLVAINDGQWHHIVCWHDTSDSKLKVTIDDGPVASASTATYYTDNAVFKIGGAATVSADMTLGPTGRWSGRVPTAAEITALYNGGIPLQYADLTASLLSGLDSYWNMTEGSGTRVDSVGSFNLTDNNTVTSVDNTHPGFGKAASFVAANSESLSSATVFDWESPWTLVFWAKNTDTASIRGHFSFDGDNGWIYSGAGATGLHGDFWGSGIDGSVGYTLTNWNLFSVEWSGTQLRIYTNDDAGGTAGAETAIAPSAGFKFGVLGAAGFPYNGLIAHGILYSRVLTAQERTDLYNAGAGLFYS